MKSKMTIIAALMLMGVLFSPAQERFIYLKSLSIQGGGSIGISPKHSMTNVDAYGGMMEGRIALGADFSVGIELGYSRSSIDQIDAVKSWGWVYWTKYYRDYINSTWLGDSSYFKGVKVKTSSLTDEQVTSGTAITRKDGIYSATLNPVQYVNILRAGIYGTYEFPLNEMIVPYFSIGVTMYSYERNLYLDEQWAKKRTVDIGPDSGAVHVFTYGFRNYATKITGEVYGGSVGVGSDIILSDLIALRIGFRYDVFIAEFNRAAINNFPAWGYLHGNTGIVIRY
jgi:hypothetical protein